MIHKKSKNSLNFAQQWANDLNQALLKHRGDKDFQMDLLESAIIYWRESMSDDEKEDAFIYLLGLLSRV